MIELQFTWHWSEQCTSLNLRRSECAQRKWWWSKRDLDMSDVTADDIENVTSIPRTPRTQHPPRSLLRTDQRHLVLVVSSNQVHQALAWSAIPASSTVCRSSYILFGSPWYTVRTETSFSKAMKVDLKQLVAIKTCYWPIRSHQSMYPQFYPLRRSVLIPAESLLAVLLLHPRSFLGRIELTAVVCSLSLLTSSFASLLSSNSSIRFHLPFGHSAHSSMILPNSTTVWDGCCSGGEILERAATTFAGAGPKEDDFDGTRRWIGPRENSPTRKLSDCLLEWYTMEETYICDRKARDGFNSKDNMTCKLYTLRTWQSMFSKTLNALKLTKKVVSTAWVESVMRVRVSQLYLA